MLFILKFAFCIFQISSAEMIYGLASQFSFFIAQKIIRISLCKLGRLLLLLVRMHAISIKSISCDQRNSIKLALFTLRGLPETNSFLSPASLEAAESAEKEKVYFRGKV